MKLILGNDFISDTLITNTGLALHELVAVAEYPNAGVPRLKFISTSSKGELKMKEATATPGQIQQLLRKFCGPTLTRFASGKGFSTWR